MNVKSIENQIIDKFDTLFHASPLLVRSPGRINILGEHTDYNLGFVLPAAIDRSITLAIAHNNDKAIRLYALDLGSYFETNLDSIARTNLHWPDYILGVVAELLAAGHQLGGFDCVFGGNIPIGAGLSSSAALEGGVVFALNQLFGLGLTKTDMVKIAHRAEYHFVGVRCGIMDQFINIHGIPGHALLLDCKTLDFEYVPATLPGYSFVLFNSMVKHNLASSGYNNRRSECEQAVIYLRLFFPEVSSLRDVTPEMLEEHKNKMPPVLYKRSHYVVVENQRVGEACRVLRNQDAEGLGRLMHATHEGLRSEYEVSCDELNFLAGTSSLLRGSVGARMVGGGFGGCTLHLVRTDCLIEFSRELSGKFQEQFGMVPEYYEVAIDRGTHLVAY